MSNEDRFSQLYSAARRAAGIVANANRDYVNEADLAQTGVLWLLEHPQRVEHNTMPDGRLAYKRLVSEVTRHLVSVAKAERREVLGFDPDSEYQYSEKLVETVLPGVFDKHYRPAALERVQLSVPGSRARTPHDPASSDNWSTFVVDVRSAIDAVCSDEDKRVLFTRSVGGWTWDQFGDVYAQSGSTFRLRFKDAVRRIVLFLNAGVVLETSVDADVLAEEIHGIDAAQRVAATPDWDTAGRDPYRSPDE